MGQYYHPTLLIDGNTGKRAECFHPLSTGNGSKLMEHSWIGNRFVNGVVDRIRELTRHGAEVRLVWMGDYAYDMDDMDDRTHREAYVAAWGDYIGVNTPVTPQSCYQDMYVHNLDRNVYVRIPGTEPGSGSDRTWVPHPLPLLTAMGNGLGGGDYEGTDMDRVGSWAYDRIAVLDRAPAGAEELEVSFKESE